MAQNVILAVAQDVAINATAQALMQATGIPARLVGSNDMIQALVNGHGYALTNDMVLWFFNGESKLLKGDWMEFEDEALYNSLVNYGFMVTDIDLMIAQRINEFSPLDPSFNRAITLGSIGVLTNTMRDWVERNSGNSVFLNRLVHPTSLLF